MTGLFWFLVLWVVFPVYAFGRQGVVGVLLLLAGYFCAWVAVEVFAAGVRQVMRERAE